MPLGRACHRLGTRIDGPHGPAELPSRHREERLHRYIQLAAEGAPHRRRDHVHPGRIDTEDAGDLVAVHVRGLRADKDADPVADPLGPPCLQLDVGVLDVRGFEFALGH